MGFADMLPYEGAEVVTYCTTIGNPERGELLVFVTTQ